MVLLLGPLPEEFGWHGYLLDRLQERHGAVMSGVSARRDLGCLWHLPLFFLQGTYQYEQGAFTIWFWTFMIAIIPLEVVMAWIYNCTRRSTFGIILFHFVGGGDVQFPQCDTRCQHRVHPVVDRHGACWSALFWAAPRRPMVDAR